MLKSASIMLVIILLSCLFSSVVGGLYNSSDPMAILNNKNFYETVIGSKSGWIIEFYNSWCGHCINFAPTWREFAKDVKEWSPTIKVGVIDCADDENVAICRDYEVMAYPSIKLFGAYSKKGDIGRTISGRKVAQIQENIIDFIVEMENTNNGSDLWGNLLPYKEPIGDVFKKIPKIAKNAVLIVEGTDSRIGSHVILDLKKYSMVYVRRMEAGIGEVRDISSVPALIVVNRDGKRETLTEDVTTREEVTALIINHLKLTKTLAELNTLETSGNYGMKMTTLDKEEMQGAADGHPDEISSDKLNYDDDLPDTAFRSYSPLNQVYMVDMENSIAYALRHEVLLHKLIEGESLAALKKFVSVLVKYFPGRPYIRKFLSNLNDYISNHKEIQGKDFESALHYLNSQYSVLPDQQPWVGCLGSQPNYRGYTCGLWTLFHTLTVNAALVNRNNVSYDPRDTLKGILGFVKHFFSCEYCSKHFQEMYAVDAAESSFTSPSDKIMWLWRAHNQVNKRLKGDLSEDPKYVKQPFPSKERCPMCWMNERTFVEAEVLKYLKGIYGSGAISFEGTQDLAQIYKGQNNKQAKIFDSVASKFLGLNDSKKVSGVSKYESANGSNWGFSSMDVNLCVLLYACSTLIIIAGYFMFVIKRRLRRKKYIELYKNT